MEIFSRKRMAEDFIDEGYIDCDVIARCMEWCNMKASDNVNPVLFFDPLVLENKNVETCGTFFWKFFAKKNFGFLTARYFFIPINTMHGTHWEVLLVDLKNFDIYNFNSLLASPNKDYYHLYSDTSSYSRDANAFRKTFIIPEPDKGARDGFNQLSEEAAQKAVQFVALYNAYICFARRACGNKVVMPRTEESDTKFSMFVKRYRESQIGNTCGLYVMGLACHIVRCKGHFNIDSFFPDPDTRFNLSRKAIQKYSAHFSQIFTKPLQLHPQEILGATCTNAMYKIFNCLTIEGAFGYVASKERSYFTIPDDCCLGEREQASLCDKWTFVCNYFNPSPDGNVYMYRMGRKNFMFNTRFNVVEDESQLEKEIDPSLHSAPYNFNVCFALCKTPSPTGRYKFAVSINITLYASGLRYFNPTIPMTTEFTRPSFKYIGSM